MVFVENEVDKRNKLYKKVKDNGYAAELKKQDADQLMRWAAGILSKDGKKITRQVMEYFMERTGDDMENIRMELEKLICYTMGRRETEDALAAVGLAGCLRQPARELSGGMRRRVAILRALLAEYDLLFLDEPFKGLDRETKETVMADTRRRCAGRTVLLVTHDVAELDAMGAVVRLDLST